MHKYVLSGNEIDRLNRDKLDNRLSNLRVVTHRENLQNGSAHRDSTSRYKGVSFHKGKWRAQICHNGKKMALGQFPAEHHAALAYDLWAHSLNRKTNFPLAC